MDVSVTETSQQAKISEKRCIDIYQYLQDVCSAKLLATPIMLGGQGIIDNSLFSHSQKVNL